MFDCKIGGLLVHNPASKDDLVSVSLNHHPDSLVAYSDPDVEDEWVKAAIRHGILGARVLRGSQVLEFDALIKTPFWEKCLKINDVIDTLAIPVTQDSHWTGFMSIHAHSQRGFFTDADVRLGQHLQPFIKAALASYLAVVHERRRAKLAISGVSATRLAFILFNKDRKVIFADERTQTLSRGILNTLTQDGPLASPIRSVSDWIEAFVAASAHRMDRERIERLAVIDPESGQEFILQLSDIGHDIGPEGLPTDKSHDFMLIVRTAEDWRVLDMRPAAKIFDLTHSETDILGALAKGESVDDIATARQAKPSTIRWHIKNAMAKTDCQRQLDLILKIQALSLPMLVQA